MFGVNIENSLIFFDFHKFVKMSISLHVIIKIMSDNIDNQ